MSLSVYTNALDIQARTFDVMFGSEYGRRVGQAMLDYRQSDDRLATGVDAELMQSSMARALRLGSTFIWSRSTCDLLIASARDMPSYTLVDEHIPSHDGFMVFEKPLPLGGGVDEWPLTAVSWAVVRGLDTDDPRVIEAARNGRKIIALDPDDASGIATLCIWFYLEMDAWGYTPFTYLQWSVGMATEESSFFTSEERTRMKLQYLGAAFTFMNSHITMQRRNYAPRAVARRVARSIDATPLVNVIELRRREYQTVERTTDEAMSRDYHVQWIVRGHWRQQWYPSLGRHQPKWIAPYVKGPEGKPLKTPRTNVFAVVR